MINSDISEIEEAGENEPLPDFPFGTLTVYVICAVMGIFFIIIGLVEGLTGMDPVLGATFWMLGGFLLVPSGFYSERLIKALRTEQAGEFVRIMKNIPLL